MLDRFFTTVPPRKPVRVRVCVCVCVCVRVCACVSDRLLYIHIYKQQGPTVWHRE